MRRQLGRTQALFAVANTLTQLKIIASDYVAIESRLRVTKRRERLFINQLSASTSEKSKMVLLVDDSADIRDLFTLLSEHSHFHLVTAEDGLDGLKKLVGMGVDPEIVFIDLTMPLMDGLEFLEKVRSLGLASTSRIVICSGLEKNLSGCPPNSEWLAKPFEIKDVLRVIFQKKLH